MIWIEYIVSGSIKRDDRTDLDDTPVTVTVYTIDGESI